MFRRTVFLILGVLECLAAVVLFVFAWKMPGAAEVHDGLSRVADLTEQTSGQVARLREELHTLRDQRPKLHALAENLRTQMALATENLKDQRIDYSAVQALQGALGDMAKGLDSLADTINPDGVRRIADGFKGAADFLDDQVAPTVDRLDEAAALQTDPHEPATTDLRDASARLRQAQKGLTDVAARWPELRKTLTDSARLLRATQVHMEEALAHHDDYDKAMNQAVVLARTYSAALPLMTEEVEEQLRDQEDSLQNLGDSIDRTTAVLPEWDHTAARVLETTRLLLFLMGAIFGLHGMYLTIGAWGRRRRAA